jgi:hypothetical protein
MVKEILQVVGSVSEAQGIASAVLIEELDVKGVSPSVSAPRFRKTGRLKLVSDLSVRFLEYQ